MLATACTCNFGRSTGSHSAMYPFHQVDSGYVTCFSPIVIEFRGIKSYCETLLDCATNIAQLFGRIAKLLRRIAKLFGRIAKLFLRN